MRRPYRELRRGLEVPPTSVEGDLSAASPSAIRVAWSYAGFRPSASLYIEAVGPDGQVACTLDTQAHASPAQLEGLRPDTVYQARRRGA